MSSHLDDEEQLEALKRWWREHGVQWLLIIVVGVSAWFGWNTWQDNREARKQAASLAYTQLLNEVSQSGELSAARREALHNMADELRSEFSGSAYAHYTALLQARLAVDVEDYPAAADYLRMVVDSRADESTALLARVRLARVLGGAGDVEEGLRVLDAVDAKDFAAQFAEVRGDLLLLKGDETAAAEAYVQALELGGGSGVSSLLELKLSRLTPGGLIVQSASDNGISPAQDEVDNP